MMKETKNIQNWIMGLCCAVAITACSEADTLSPEESNIPIAFQTEDNWGDAPVSKAARATDAFPYNEFGVYAYYQADGSSEAQPFMAAQLVEREEADASWTYSPTKYWPQNGTLSFYGYHPYAHTNITFGVEEGKHILTYSPCDGKTDLLMATATGQTFATDGEGVKLNFQHQLARLDFQLHNDWNDSCAIGVSFIKYSGDLYKTLKVNAQDQSQTPDGLDSLSFESVVDETVFPIAYDSSTQKEYTPVAGNILLIPFPKGDDDKTVAASGTIEMGINFYVQDDTGGWKEQLPFPSYVAKANVSNVILEKGGITTFQLSFGGPEAGIQVIYATQTPGWTNVNNDNKI